MEGRCALSFTPPMVEPSTESATRVIASGKRPVIDIAFFDEGEVREQLDNIISRERAVCIEVDATVLIDGHAYIKISAWAQDTTQFCCRFFRAERVNLVAITSESHMLDHA